jgi:hypothetical protein
MLSKLVVKFYPVLMEILLWLILIVGFSAGFQARGFIGGILGLVIAAISGAVILGTLFVLVDIRKKLDEISKVMSDRN